MHHLTPFNVLIFCIQSNYEGLFSGFTDQLSTWGVTLETWPRSDTGLSTVYPHLSRRLLPTTSQRESQMCGDGSHPHSLKQALVSFIFSCYFLQFGSLVFVDMTLI